MLAAIAKEIHDLCRTGAFELVPLPSQVKPISSRTGDEATGRSLGVHMPRIRNNWRIVCLWLGTKTAHHPLNFKTYYEKLARLNGLRRPNA